MGRWGGNIVTRGRWDPAGFAAQTPEFVTGSDVDDVSFGYSGQRTADVSTGIATADVAWLLQYLGRVSDRQLHQMLEASGASEEEAGAFAAAIGARIAQLVAAAPGGGTAASLAARSAPTHP